jgi:hypothetical protein
VSTAAVVRIVRTPVDELMEMVEVSPDGVEVRVIEASEKTRLPVPPVFSVVPPLALYVVDPPIE